MLDHMVIHLFSILRNCQTVFQSGCIISHPQQQCIRVVISPYPHRHVIIYLFFPPTQFNLLVTIMYVKVFGPSAMVFHRHG